MSRKEIKDSVVIFGCLIALHVGVLWFVDSDFTNPGRVRDNKRSEGIIKGGSIVKIVGAEFQRVGTKPANYVTLRYVTCENASGRFNIATSVGDPVVPLAGETWEIGTRRQWRDLKLGFKQRVK